MSYHRVETSSSVRRAFEITVGLTEGYSGTGVTHGPDEVLDAFTDWMKEKAASNQPYLTATLMPATLAYAWKDRGGEAIGKNEPAVVLSGVVPVTHKVSALSDEEVKILLDELADCLGRALVQTRVYISYREETWIREVDGKTTPRVEQ